MRERRGRGWFAAVVVLLCVLAMSSQQTQPNNQNLPDAPTPNRQTPPPPVTPPPTPLPPGPNTQTTPLPNQTTTPGDTTKTGSDRDQLFTFSKNVNFVQVPVLVKDDSGRLVDGLSLNDFAIYEDGEKQTLNFFTSDPFPLSTAVVIDVGMPDMTMKKINETMSALAGAFGQSDEVAVYTYGNTVNHDIEFSPANDNLGTKLRRLNKKGRNNGAPVTSGPFNAGPTVNGQPYPGTPAVRIPPPDSYVLNDAILAAAQGLAKRDRKRRKVIFVISDGKEHGSRASYGDVLRVLLSHEIMVYGIATDAAGLPLIGPVERADIHGGSVSWKPP